MSSAENETKLDEQNNNSSSEQQEANKFVHDEDEEHHQNPAPPAEDDDDDDDDDEDDDDDVIRTSFQHQQDSAHDHQQQYNDDDDELNEPEEEYTSIWDIVGNYSTSPLESMLSKDNVTLAQILDEDTLIQEVKGANAKVLEFLTREQNIKQIISYLTTEHFEYKEEDDEQTKVIFKFPYVISEIISCELDEFNDHLVSKEEYIIQLLSYFTQRDASKTCVNSLLCSYVIKALSTLLTKHYINITNVLLSKQIPIEKVIVEHIDLNDMDTFTLKLLGFEVSDDNSVFGGEQFGEFGNAFGAQRVRELFLMKQRGNDKQLEEQKKHVQEHALENDILNLFLTRLEKFDEEACRNLFSLWTTIVEKGNSLLQNKILSKDFMSRVMDILVKMPANSSCFVFGIAFLKVVIEACELYSDGVSVPEALAAIHARTNDFILRLAAGTPNSSSSSSNNTMTLSFGPLNPPLGEERLKTIDHLALLFKCSYPSIHADLIQYKALSTMLKLFFEYAFNSMLHVSVFNVIKHIVEQSSNVELKKHLVLNCDLVQEIVTANANNDKASIRLGYMGHLIEMSNMLRKASLSQTTFAYLASEQALADEKLEEQRKTWKAFVEGPLAEMNAQQEKTLGGPLPIGGSSAAAMQNSMYQFDNDDDDEEDFIEDDSDDSDDSDDEVVVKKSDSGDQ